MTPLEDAMTSVPDTATREEARAAMGILQAEVERLSAELADYKTGRPFATEALTKLARVETLAAEWVSRGHRSDIVYEDAGEAILEALRGEL
jgi:hypothetical protein